MKNLHIKDNKLVLGVIREVTEISVNELINSDKVVAHLLFRNDLENIMGMLSSKEFNSQEECIIWCDQIKSLFGEDAFYKSE